MLNRLRFSQFASGCALLALAGCASAPKTAPQKYTFFPPSPDEPRIQFLTSFESDFDLGKTSGFADFITGKTAGEKNLVKPYGIAIHGGQIFVCDTLSANVEVFDVAKKRARYFTPRA